MPVRSILSAVCVCVLLAMLLPALDSVIDPGGAGSGYSGAFAQDSPCAGCDTVLADIELWESRLANPPSDASESDLARAGQALAAAKNLLNRCVNNGCIEAPAIVETQQPSSDSERTSDGELPALACHECEGLYYAWMAAERARAENSGGEVTAVDTDMGLEIILDDSGAGDAERAYHDCVISNCLGTSTPDDGPGTGGVQAPDSDGDGVPDDVDACPGTSLGAVVDAAGCPQQLQLRYRHEGYYAAPGELVVIKGVVDDANGNALSGAQLAIEVEGTDLSTSALSGTIEHEGWFDAFLPLPLDLPCGTYTVQVTASAGGYLDATDTMSIYVGVGAAKMFIQLKTNDFYVDYTEVPANVPIGEKTEWRIIVSDEKTGVEIPDANLEITVTHPESGTSNRYSSLSTTRDPAGYSVPWHVWNFTWSDEHEGSWQIEVAASKDGYCPAYCKKSFTVGAHIVEIRRRPDAYSCWPHCRPTCSRNTVLIGHHTYGSTVCGVVGECSLGHPVRYEWTAEAGSIANPNARAATWIPPEVPGKYRITCRVICTENPDVWDSATLWVHAMSREEFLHGRIDLHGFDRVRIESVDGGLADVWSIEGEDDEEYEDLECEAGQWLEGDDWEVMTLDDETKVTLGVYKDGEKLGEVQVGGGAGWAYRVKNIQDSILHWPSKASNPNSIFINERPAPPQYIKPIDWNVKAENFTVGVYGTKYFVALDPDTDTDIIGVLEGEVAVTPLLFEAPPQVIAGRQWITVDEAEFGQLEEMTDEQVGELQEAFGESANTPPTASFTFMPAEPQAGDDIVVASTSSDPDGDLLTLSWYLNGEQLSEIGSQSDWEWENVEAGEYTLLLRVEDGRGGIDEHSAMVVVRASGQESANRPPSASFDLMPLDPTPEDTIVGVSTSSDPDGDVLIHSWYVDGEYAVDIGDVREWEWPSPAEGEYTIGLVVMDGAGGVDEYSRTVTVVGAGAEEEDVGSGGGGMSGLLYLLLIPVAAAIAVLVVRRHRRR